MKEQERQDKELGSQLSEEKVTATTANNDDEVECNILLQRFISLGRVGSVFTVLARETDKETRKAFLF